MSVFERLRNRPTHEKARYAFLGASVATLLIAGVWVTTIPARFTQISVSVDSAETQTGAVRAGFGDFMNGIDDIVTEAEIDQLGGNTLENEEVPRETQGALEGLMEWKANEVATSTAFVPVATTTRDVLPPPLVSTGTETVSDVPVAKPRIIQIGTTTKRAE